MLYALCVYGLWNLCHYEPFSYAIPLAQHSIYTHTLFQYLLFTVQ
jgi:hypothetical protein